MKFISAISNIYFQTSLFLLNSFIYTGLFITLVRNRAEIDDASSLGHWGDWQTIIGLSAALLAGAVGLDRFKDPAIQRARREAAELKSLAQNKSDELKKLTEYISNRLGRHKLQSVLDLLTLFLLLILNIVVLYISSLRYGKNLDLIQVYYISFFILLSLTWPIFTGFSKWILLRDIRNKVKLVNCCSRP